ncbi:hypothetical protein J6590_038047 [Homalodisca vitripennis]|nr:hypothetical protein J6590_038047 [Homalodisca vitripennis]
MTLSTAHRLAEVTQTLRAVREYVVSTSRIHVSLSYAETGYLTSANNIPDGGAMVAALGHGHGHILRSVRVPTRHLTELEGYI